MLSPTSSSKCYSPVQDSQNPIHSENSNANEAIDNLFSDALEKSNQLNQADKQQQRRLRKIENKAAKQERMTKALDKGVKYHLVIPSHAVLDAEKINSLRFSQDSICDQTRDGMSLDKLREEIKKGWKKGESLRVVKMPDDKYTSLDNRRLFATKEICSNGSPTRIEADFYDHGDMAPQKLFNGIVHDYKNSRKLDNINNIPPNIKPNTYGHCIALRINTRSGDLKSNNFGFSTMPHVRKT